MCMLSLHTTDCSVLGCRSQVLLSLLVLFCACKYCIGAAQTAVMLSAVLRAEQGT